MQIDETASAIYNEYPESYFVGTRGFHFQSSMTALAYVFSAGGFAIAADGFDVLRTGRHCEIVSRTAQKIFPIHGVGREAASSFTGRITLYDDIADQMPVFNFVSEFARAADEIRDEPARDANEFLSKACSIVQQRLRDVKEQGALQRYPRPMPPRIGERGYSIANVYIDGYFNDAPYRSGMRFFHDNHELGFEYALHALDMASRIHMLGSSPVARSLFETPDARLTQYRTEAYQRGLEQAHLEITTLTLKDAIEIARNYIAACSDPAAMEVDGFCEWLGGHMHAATITPDHGFEWVVPPIQPET